MNIKKNNKLSIIEQNKGIGKRLQILRIAHLENEQLSYVSLVKNANLDIAPNTYGGYERGERTLSIEILIKLSSYYEVSADFILFGNESFGSTLKENKNIRDTYHEIKSDYINNPQLNNAIDSHEAILKVIALLLADYFDLPIDKK